MKDKKKSSSFRGKVVSSFEKQKEAKGGRGYLNLPKGVKLFRFPDDARSFKMDFLPYEVTNAKHPELNEAEGIAVQGSLWYRSPFKVHSNVGSDNETVVCPRTFGKKCPICEYQREIIKKGADKEEFKLLYPKERSLYVVVPVGHKDYDEDPHIWDISDFLFQETLMDELRESEENEDFFTLDNGKTASLRIKWKEIGKNNFPEVVSVSFIERDEEYSEDILEDVPKLDDCLKVLSYEELYAKFHFDPEAAVEADAEPEEEVHSRRRSKSLKEEKEEPEEKEEAPARRRRRSEDDEEKEEKKEKEKEEEPVRTRERSRAKKDEDEEKCPFGHKFGVDTDEYKDCNKCKIWEDCIDEKEKNEKK